MVEVGVFFQFKSAGNAYSSRMIYSYATSLIWDALSIKPKTTNWRTNQHPIAGNSSSVWTWCAKRKVSSTVSEIKKHLRCIWDVSDVTDATVSTIKSIHSTSETHISFSNFKKKYHNQLIKSTLLIFINVHTFYNPMTELGSTHKKKQ